MFDRKAWWGLAFVCVAGSAAASDGGDTRVMTGIADPSPHVLLWLLLSALAVAVAFAAWGVVLCRNMRTRSRALQASETRFAALFDGLPDMAWIKDMDGRFLAVNAALAKSCGAAGPEAMIGRTCYDYFPREIADAYRRNDNLVLRRLTPMLVLEPYTGRDGAMRRIESSKAPFLDELGRCIGTIGVSREVPVSGRACTALGQATDALRASEARFRTAMDALPVGLLEIDRDGTIAFATELAWSILGLSACQGYDGPWFNLIHTSDLPAIIVASRNMRAKGELLNLEVRLAEGRPSSARWVHVRGVRCRDTEGATLSILDISATRRPEQHLAGGFHSNGAGGGELRSHKSSPAGLYDGIRTAAGS